MPARHHSCNMDEVILGVRYSEMKEVFNILRNYPSGIFSRAFIGLSPASPIYRESVQYMKSRIRGNETNLYVHEFCCKDMTIRWLDRYAKVPPTQELVDLLTESILFEIVVHQLSRFI